MRKLTLAHVTVLLAVILAFGVVGYSNQKDLDERFSKLWHDWFTDSVNQGNCIDQLEKRVASLEKDRADLLRGMSEALTPAKNDDLKRDELSDLLGPDPERPPLALANGKGQLVEPSAIGPTWTKVGEWNIPAISEPLRVSDYFKVPEKFHPRTGDILTGAGFPCQFNDQVIVIRSPRAV
ncbi:MAG: hypothetical protein WC797_02205, partial [Candidatus Paceibacterota bacterium]